MPTIIGLIWTLLVGLTGGANSIRTLATPHAQRYLEVLVGLAWRGTLVPLGIAGIGILGGMTKWQPWLWSSVIAFAGIVSFLYLGLLLSLATPIGALIGAALPAGQTPARTAPQPVTWKSLLSPDWIVRLIRGAGQWTTDQLREGVGRYFSLVRKVLAWEVFIFFFVAAAPPLRSATLILILGAIAIAISSKFLSEGWARITRIAVVVLMAWWVLGSIFPELNPFTYVFTKSAEALTMEVVAQRGGVWKDWINQNWNTPTFAVLALLFGALAYGMVKLGKRVIAYIFGTPIAGTTGGSGHQTATVAASTHGSGQGSGWLGKAVMIGCLALCVGMAAIMVMKAMELNERRNAHIDASMRDARLSEDALRTMSLLAQVNGRAAAVQTATPKSAPAATQEIWNGLQNPRKYVFQFTTNWSQKMYRPAGMSVRMVPTGLRPEVRINGTEILKMRVDGTTPFPHYTEFFEVRMTNGVTPIEVTIGIGKEVN